MIKFFGAFVITTAFLLFIPDTAPDVQAKERIVAPQVIGNKKKIDSIKVPASNCIVNGEGNEQLFEQHVMRCINKRNWLNINIVDGEEAAF